MPVVAWVKRLLPAVWAVLTVAVVGTVVWFGMGQLRHGPPVSTADDVPPPTTHPSYVKVGHDYYVLVKLVEFTPHKPDGDSWDVRGGAPDAKVLLYWHDQQIFALPQRTDQLINVWDLFRVNLVDVARSGGSLDIASSINAPIVRVEPGGPLTVEVWDADTFTPDDLALKIDLPLAELVEGENDIRIPPGSGVRRLTVQLIDRETSLSDLIAIAEKR